MRTNESSEQEADASNAQKRAEWEAFEFQVPAQGYVKVENGSYGDESDDHVYVVETDGDSTVNCTCPANKHRSGRCKHRHAVEDRPVVLLTATKNDDERNAVMADGGTVETDEDRDRNARFGPLKPKSEVTDVDYCSKYHVPATDCIGSDDDGGCPHDTLTDGGSR